MPAWLLNHASTWRGVFSAFLLVTATLTLGLCPRIHNVICPKTPWDQEHVFTETVNALTEAVRTVPVEGHIAGNKDSMPSILALRLLTIASIQDQSAIEYLSGADTSATNPNGLRTRLENAKLFELSGMPANLPSFTPDSLASILAYWFEDDASMIIAYVPKSLTNERGLFVPAKLTSERWNDLQGFVTPFGRSGNPDSLLVDTERLLARFVSANKAHCDSVDIETIMARTDERLFHHVRNLRKDKWYIIPYATLMMAASLFGFGLGVVPAIRNGRRLRDRALEQFPTAPRPPYWSIVFSNDFARTLKAYQRQLLEERRAWQRRQKGAAWEKQDRRRTAERIEQLERDIAAFAATLTADETGIERITALLAQARQEGASAGIRQTALVMARQTLTDHRAPVRPSATAATTSSKTHQFVEPRVKTKSARIVPATPYADHCAPAKDECGIFAPQKREDVVAGLELHDLVPNGVRAEYASAILVLGVLESMRRGRRNIGKRYRAVEILREDVARYFGANFDPDGYEDAFSWLVRTRVVLRRKNKRHQAVFSLNPHAKDATAIGGTVIRRTLRYQFFLNTTIH